MCVWVCFIHCHNETDVEERGRRRRENLPRGFIGLGGSGRALVVDRRPRDTKAREHIPQLKGEFVIKEVRGSYSAAHDMQQAYSTSLISCLNVEKRISHFPCMWHVYVTCAQGGSNSAVTAAASD